MKTTTCRLSCGNRPCGALGALPLLAAALWMCGPVRLMADDVAAIKITRTYTVSETGDAQIKLQTKMSAETYTTAKSNHPNTAVLLRRLLPGVNWAKLDNVRGQFEDSSSTVTIEYTQLGAARMTGDDQWELVLEPDSKLELLGAFDNTAIFSTSAQTDMGAASVNLRIVGPATAKDLQLKNSPERVTYQFSPAPVQGTSPAASFSLDARAKVMSALAKSYADSRLTGLWVARAVLKNTGDQVLSDYRVRFRLPPYAEWSEWKRSRRVLPGQTVVDAYFPLLDVERLSQISGSRPAMIEVEYEYRQQDGRTVREGTTQQIQLLGRNQVVFSNLSDDAVVGFFDKYNLAPMLLSAFINGDDVVMQELASRINRAVGISNVASKDDDAKKFLVNLYAFLGTNNMTHQTPLTDTLRFGRDTLQNRAGTYLDLAVLVASASEAAGLKTTLYLMPGNCLPSIRLPNGTSVALDLTKPSGQVFSKAAEEGERLVKEARTKGELCEIELSKWRGLGVQSLDLSKFEEGFLEKNYRFVASSQSFQSGSSGSTTTSSSQTSGDASKLAGRWTLRQTPDGRTVEYTLVLSAEGKYTYRIVITSSTQPTSDMQETGTFSQDGTLLKFQPGEGKPQNVYSFRLRNDELDLQLQGSATLVTFQRSK